MFRLENSLYIPICKAYKYIRGESRYLAESANGRPLATAFGWRLRGMTNIRFHSITATEATMAISTRFSSSSRCGSSYRSQRVSDWSRLLDALTYDRGEWTARIVNSATSLPRGSESQNYRPPRIPDTNIVAEVSSSQSAVCPSSSPLCCQGLISTVV